MFIYYILHKFLFLFFEIEKALHYLQIDFLFSQTQKTNIFFKSDFCFFQNHFLNFIHCQMIIFNVFANCVFILTILKQSQILAHLTFSN